MIEFKYRGSYKYDELPVDQMVYLMIVSGGWIQNNMEWKISMNCCEGYVLTVNHPSFHTEDVELFNTLDELIAKLSMLIKAYSYE